MPENTPKRAMLNTTINEEVLKKFREHCKAINCPMNTILETFMIQFANGDFSLTISRNRRELEIED